MRVLGIDPGTRHLGWGVVERNGTRLQHIAHGVIDTDTEQSLAPRLVGDHRNAEPVDFGRSFEPADRAWTMKDRSVPGHIGDPREASAEKGETLFRVFSESVVALLERVLAWDGKSWNG